MSERRNTLPQVPRRDLPAQEGWARKAEQVRGPVSSFAFRLQANANARALEAEQARVAVACGLMREYAVLFEQIGVAQKAATALHARRELAGDFLDHEMAEQWEGIDEARHRRVLAAKRREQELIEAETRCIEAKHAQEALERFKEPKFKAGLARFQEKEKGYQVGTASADAAIAETATQAKPDSRANASEEVGKLVTLLQSTLAAIDEGERVGRDTQVLRERAELYKQLLHLA